MCVRTRTLLVVDRMGTRELRANLAAALRQAGTGERVVITVDGRAVAQLGPVEPAGAPTLEELAASGLVDPPRRADRPAAPAALDAAVDVRLDRVLAEVRGG
jgi:antitoxin (DNA-binding transcriptional repressor) of toxin-antitoxin stability system